MRVALCLYGYYNNRADSNAGDKGFEYIKNNILNEGHDVDIFVHSWDVDNQSKIISNYEPTSHEIEPQVNFNTIAKSRGIDENKINEGFNRQSTMYKTCSIQASLSFFYSRSRALQLAITNANNNDFTYDCVIACRFDLGQRGGWHLGYNVAQMKLNFNLDMNYIYSAMWMQTNAGYGDMWFFSNQENMELLSTMYDNALHDYFQIGSDYHKTLTSGWPDSNAKNELSNERFNPNSNTTLVKYPKWQMINNHIMHKWHFLKTGLYGKSLFIGEKR